MRHIPSIKNVFHMIRESLMGSTGFALRRLALLQSWIGRSRLHPPPASPVPIFSGKLSSYAKALSMDNQTQKKPRILCLHGFRTSAAILQKLIGRWPETVLEKMDLDFLDGPFPAGGKSDVEGIFDPPYYEWYQSSQDYKEYRNFEESMAYIEQYMINHGPFDGLLGFSQGAFISAAVPGMQSQGVGFTNVPKIKFLILISGAKFVGHKFGQPKLAANAFSSPIGCPSLHIIGEMDFLKPGGMELLESFVDPVVIHHPKGHIIPTLDEKGREAMVGFIDRVLNMPRGL